MGFRVRILADSLAPCGKRLTTFELTYPRFIHSEFMTHRQLSRNASSSRAIPIKVTIAKVAKEPAGPVWWGKNQSGMQAREELAGWRRSVAQFLVYSSRWFMLLVVWLLWKVGLHKQVANRYIEPWSWITVIASATEWTNLFALRDHPDAQPEFALLAAMMKVAYVNATPRKLEAGEWHLPFIDDGEAEAIHRLGLDVRAVSTGRCARVSYLTHDGRRDFIEDVKLHDKLRSADPGHWSPFEHIAMACGTQERSGNFVGFRQYRKEFPNECIDTMRGLAA